MIQPTGLPKKFREAGILDENITEELFKSLELITLVYPRNKEDLVPSHNDLKPENILYDGSRPWLSDWEAAFTNDIYSDLSIVANFVVVDEKRGRQNFLKFILNEMQLNMNLQDFI